MSETLPRPSRKKSCARCITAKAKCKQIEGGACERCARLRRECVFENKSTRQLRKNASRVARLEEKVDGLLSILSTQQTGPQAPIGKPANPITPSLSPYSQTPSAESSATPWAPPTVTSAITPPASPSELDIIDRGLLTLQRAEGLLEKFRTVKTPEFPFVVIPPETTAAALRDENPFLFLCIMTVCLEDDNHLCRILGNEVKYQISQRIIMENQKKLCYLQGLLVHLAWYHYQFQPMHKQTHMFLMMARAMCLNLGLDRDSSVTDFRLHAQPESCTAGQRAFLGCYYLCSTFSLFNRNLAMYHSAWIDTCVKKVSDDPAVPTDAFIPFFVNSQIFISRLHQTFSYDNPDPASTSLNPTLLNMSIASSAAEASAFKQQLDTVCPSGPPPTLGQTTLAMHLAIYEISLHTHPTASSETASTSAPAPPPPTPNPSHPAHLLTLLTTAKDFTHHFLALTPSQLYHLTITYWFQVWYSLITLVKLSLLPSSPGTGWDAPTARAAIDLVRLVDCITDAVRPLTRTGWQTTDPLRRDTWSYYYRFMRGMRIWLRRREAAGAGAAGASGTTAAAACTVADAVFAGDAGRIGRGGVPELGRNVFAEVVGLRGDEERSHLARLAKEEEELLRKEREVEGVVAGNAGGTATAAATTPPPPTSGADDLDVLGLWDEEEWRRLVEGGEFGAGLGMGWGLAGWDGGMGMAGFV